MCLTIRRLYMMSKWLTMQEILNSPVQAKNKNNYLKTIYPNFMKRKVYLSERYERTTRNFAKEESKQTHRKTVSETNPSLRGFQPYGRVNEKIRSIFEKDQVKQEDFYDEAQENQNDFIHLSPIKADSSEFKTSYCPKEANQDTLMSPKKKEKKNRSQNNINRKSKPKFDLDFKNVTKSNVLVLLSRNSPRKCQTCGKLKCECLIVDEEIPEKLYQNIQKGRAVIEQSKKHYQKPKLTTKMFSFKTSLNKTEKNNSYFLNFFENQSKDPNLIEGTPIVLHRRLLSDSVKYKKTKLC